MAIASTGLEDETFAAIRKMAWISEKVGEPMANVALAWAREMPGVTSLLMGARNQSQLERNLTSLVRPSICTQHSVSLFHPSEYQVYRASWMILWRIAQNLSLEPTVMELLKDAGAEVKHKLGKNLDPYESADSTRIV